MVPCALLGRSQSSWQHKSFVARALAASPSTLFWKRFHHLSARRSWLALKGSGAPWSLSMWPPCSSYQNRLQPEFDSTCRDFLEKVCRIFQECPQLSGNEWILGWVIPETVEMRPKWFWGSLRKSNYLEPCLEGFRDIIYNRSRADRFKVASQAASVIQEVVERSKQQQQQLKAAGNCCWRTCFRFYIAVMINVVIYIKICTFQYPSHSSSDLLR